MSAMFSSEEARQLTEEADPITIKNEAALRQLMAHMYEHARLNTISPAVFALYLRTIIPDTYRLTNWEHSVIRQAQTALGPVACDERDTQVSGAPFPEPMHPRTVLVAIICVLLSLAGFLLVYELIR